MMRLKPKRKENYKIDLIRKYRRESKTITDIGEILGMTKQGVWDYIKRYNLDEGLDNK